jgi:hypothetical protein
MDDSEINGVFFQCNKIQEFRKILEEMNCKKNEECRFNALELWDKKNGKLGKLLTFHYNIFENSKSRCYKKNRRFKFCSTKLLSPCTLESVNELKFKSETIFPYTTILNQRDKLLIKSKLNFSLEYLPVDENLKLYSRIYPNRNTKMPEWKITNFFPFHSCTQVCEAKGMKCKADLGQCKFYLSK